MREHSNKFFQLLPFTAPILLVIGVILFFEPKNEPINFSTVKVTLVTEGLAQVDFPKSPETTKGKDLIDGFEVARVTHLLNLAEGKVNLRFTVDEYPKEYPTFTEDLMFEATKNHLIAQGFIIEESLVLPNDTRLIKAVQKDKGARIDMRLYITDREIYRILATSMKGHHEDSRIEKFMGSFKVNKTN